MERNVLDTGPRGKEKRALAMLILIYPSGYGTYEGGRRSTKHKLPKSRSGQGPTFPKAGFSRRK